MFLMCGEEGCRAANSSELVGGGGSGLVHKPSPEPASLLTGRDELCAGVGEGVGEIMNDGGVG